MNIGAPELLVILVVWVVPLAFIIWAVVDAAGQPDWAWQQIGQTKAVWIAVPLVSLVICGLVGLAMAIAYLASIRPQLRQAQGST